jgi:hypothetical protein
MASSRKPLLAGVAAIGIGLAGTASAQTSHVMTVPVLGGGVAQIRYFGDVPPRVVFVPAPAEFDGWTPVSSAFGYDLPFAMLDRIAAEMDRRAAAMFRYAEAMADRAVAGGFAETTRGGVPPGATPLGGESYSYASTISGNGMCTQSVRITSSGDGAPPRVERHSSGNCGAAEIMPGRLGTQPAAPVPTAAPPQPDLILTQSGSSPYAGMARHVASIAR